MTIATDASIADAADLMNREVIGAVVVVDHDHPVGIVTDRDLVVRGLVRRLPLDARIDNVMSSELVTLPADADLHDAMAVFQRHPIRRLPLIEDDRMIGMITVDDVAIEFTPFLRFDLGRYAGSDDPLLGALGDLRTIRSGGTLLSATETRALLEGAGLVDVREIERTWPAPVGLTAGRRS